MDQVTGPKATILVADDDPLLRMLVREILETENYTVLEAQDGMEASVLCGRHPVDMVIIDLVMPQKDGIEAIQELRSRHPEMPILAMSGAFGGVMLKAARYLGAQHTLMKPFTPDQLIDSVARQLSGS